MSCGVGRRCGSDPTLLWLWPRPAAVTPVGPLAWEPPYVKGVALKKKKKERERGRERDKLNESFCRAESPFPTG